MTVEPDLGVLHGLRDDPDRYRWEVRADDGTVLEHGQWVDSAVRAVRLGSTPASRKASKAAPDSLFAEPPTPPETIVESSLL